MINKPWTKAEIRKKVDDSIINEYERTNTEPVNASITGLAAGTEVAVGDYYVYATAEGAEPSQTDIPAFTVPIP